MNGANFVVHALKEQNVTQVFGYPGGAIMPLYDALFDGGVDHLLCRHEQGAAMAAIGYARSTGKVGVCIATSGPGATNLITGLADALLDSIPIVAITGQVPTHLIGTDAFQEVDVLGLSLACTKHSFMVETAEQLGPIIEQAFEIATSGRPGPVLIDIPKDIQVGPSVAYALAQLADTQKPLDQNLISHSKLLISEAKKPLLYVGGGVGMAKAVSELRTFIEQTQIPSVCTLKAIGCIQHDSTYFMGMVGMHGSKASNLAIQECDLLIAVGARFDDRVTGKLDEFAQHAKVIHLDVDAAEIDKLRQVTISMTDDLKQVLPAITVQPSIEQWQQHISEMKVTHANRYDHPGEPIFAPALLRQLAETMPADTVICSDVGQHQMWVAQHMFVDRPENHISSSGLGTMGFGVPAAVGAQVARPNDTVIAVSGDGSFMMNIQELGTIKRKQLPVKILLIDNQRLGMVRQWQELFFNGRFSETILTDNPDFVTLASAFDIPGETIVVKSQIEQALQRLLNSDGPYLLHVSISEEENVWPLVPPGAANDQMMESVG
ncbi:acetolactate synthase 2 catalytic subunit [Psychromonas sp. 14N.309.X.WAT.B.A12]|uniref:acetolactate synthase 2 catalytic subunit n=1 Tax=Psychromonas sp. 14N.309.X.WAT.B.A12 TaxID=2998322 RepID=UPI0025B0BDDE|nr:acetolactate synthase 2 catalytic subunit [Psychromonas sp. 14N.309.X.WAT.B.A12]MDN2664285.1 acetolactate synthase 2 catalytic subunit [Psychromonas sp. 14N.309.X.WAT.B.A12]